MGRLRDWLVRKYLPSWAVQTLLAENSKLRGQTEQMRRDYQALRAYTDGLEHALRCGAQIKITVKGGDAHGDRSDQGADR